MKVRTIESDGFIKKVTFNPEVEYRDYYDIFTYKKEIKFLGIIFRKAGYYSIDDNFRADSLKKYLESETHIRVGGTPPNERVFIRSNILIQYKNDISYRHYFDSNENGLDVFNQFKEHI